MKGEAILNVYLERSVLCPSGPLGFDFAQHRQTLRPSVEGTRSMPSGPLGFDSPNMAQQHALHVERTAEKAFMLSDRV